MLLKHLPESGLDSEFEVNDGIAKPAKNQFWCDWKTHDTNTEETHFEPEN